MTATSSQIEIPRHGRPAPVARAFGWTVLGALAAFLVNNVLVVWFGFPGLRGIGIDARGWIAAGLYAIALAVAVVYVLSTGGRSLRWDALLVHRFNTYLVRALFWGVFLVGFADASVAFLRVEDLIEPVLGKAMASGFSRPAWVGLYVHVPMLLAGFVIAGFTRTLGFPWLALLIVAAELLIVLTRFVFSYEQALMGDLVRYWYAALFLFASAFTLFDEGHVRVDIFYAGLGRSRRGFLNALGTIVLGMATIWTTLAVAFNGKQSIVNAPISIWEVSQAGAFGMFVKYQMAAFLGLFAITMLIQFVSYFFEAVADWRGEPGHRQPGEVAH